MIKERKIKGFKIDQKQNNKIIELIKAKLNPLHAKLKVFPRVKHSQTYTNGFCKREKSPTQAFLMTRMIYRGVGNYPKTQQQKSNALLQRVRKHVAEQKKKNSILNYQKADLDPFIQLFSQQNNPNDTDKRINLELLSMRRESLQAHLQDFGYMQNTRQLTSHQATDYNQFSPQQVSLMNAKLRKKINHKKMIDLHKIR